MEERQKLSASYFAQIAEGELSSADIDDSLKQQLIELRERCRRQEGGGSRAIDLASHLEQEYGGRMEWVTVLDSKGDVIQGRHPVYILADGSILDVAADQFGETTDVCVVQPDDPMMARYRPDFDEEANPMDSYKFEGWLHLWNGFPDLDQGRWNRREKGEGWWLEDTTLLQEYLEKQIVYAEQHPDRKHGQSMADEFKDRLDEIAPDNAPRP